MTVKNFSLADVIPVVDTFTDLNGDKYDIRRAKEFGAVEVAKLKRFQREIQDLQNTIDTSEDENAIIDAAQKQEGIISEFFGLLVFKMPASRVSEIPNSSKLEFIIWWQKENQPTEDELKKVQAAKRPQRKR